MQPWTLSFVKGSQGQAHDQLAHCAQHKWANPLGQAHGQGPTCIATPTLKLVSLPICSHAPLGSNSSHSSLSKAIDVSPLRLFQPTTTPQRYAAADEARWRHRVNRKPSSSLQLVETLFPPKPHSLPLTVSLFDSISRVSVLGLFSSLFPLLQRIQLIASNKRALHQIFIKSEIFSSQSYLLRYDFIHLFFLIIVTNF